ncbi:hypothetical protein [Paenibacillus durus]|uniref:Uncharacterized protein n=1 Tax=Paenibacillus durus TaxID=44251 RepID=A0A089HXP7_PAEDU|nr:hypothetical protein [Paenibacillus durus]AIQ15148.1 hypothetical protein PDUR_27245 [Paenibacillus durus]
MNKFDEKYTIRFAEKADISSIMNFIEREWKSDHIFARNRDYLCYEHQFGDKVNYILAIDKATSNLEGILGFIEASRSEEHKDIWGVMWKVREGKGNLPFLGIELMKRLMAETKCRAEIGVGANPKTSVPILKVMLGFHIDKMKHSYRLNGNTDEFKIAVINNKIILPVIPSVKQYRLQKFSSIDELTQHYDLERNKDMIPYKDAWYIERRYFQHPVYNYSVWGIQDKGQTTSAILIGRGISINNSKVLRIIDYIGDHSMLSGLYDEFGALLSSQGYEYIDFYYYGINEKHLTDAGFVLRDENDENIIPNYFEPFVQKNIDIWVNSSVSDVVICKGDGDQDRPSLVAGVS